MAGTFFVATSKISPGGNRATAMQLVAPTNRRVLVHGFMVSFSRAAVADAPFLLRVAQQDTDGTLVTTDCEARHHDKTSNETIQTTIQRVTNAGTAQETLRADSSNSPPAWAFSSGPSYEDDIDDGVDTHDGSSSYISGNYIDGSGDDVLVLDFPVPSISGPFTSVDFKYVAREGSSAIVSPSVLEIELVDTELGGGTVLGTGSGVFSGSAWTMDQITAIGSWSELNGLRAQLNAQASGDFVDITAIDLVISGPGGSLPNPTNGNVLKSGLIHGRAPYIWRPKKRGPLKVPGGTRLGWDIDPGGIVCDLTVTAWCEE